jgi:hypothetical protein
MAQYYSLETTAPVYPISGVGLGGRTTHHARGEFTPTAAITTADVVDMFDLPPRARIIGATLKAEGQIDSNGGYSGADFRRLHCWSHCRRLDRPRTDRSFVRLSLHWRENPHQARPERERGNLRRRSEDRSVRRLHRRGARVMAKTFKATWLGDTDPSAQSITIGDVTFVKGEPTNVPEDIRVNGVEFAEAIKGNPLFAVGDADAEPAEAPGESDALKAQLDAAGIRYPANASVETLRGKLPA